MAASFPFSGVMFLCTLLYISGAEATKSCEWPEFFDLSRENDQDLKPEQYSWETEAVTEADFIPSLNWYTSFKTLIKIKSSSTLEIAKYKVKKEESSVVYTCAESFGDFTYLLSSTEAKGSPAHHMCVQFTQRSYYVLQWRKLSVNSADVKCSEMDLGDMNPWPLIFLPLRQPAGDTTIYANQKYLMDYPSCPELGGFHVRVFDEKGQAVRCSNDDPSSSMDVECVHGEGIRIITGSGQCAVYGFGNKKQSKFHCLANWDEGPYTFSLLMPNDKLGMAIFHCLRFNREDPTKENAILFLDSICDPSANINTPVRNSHFQLELRRKSYTTLCDDLSDQCTNKTCSRMKYWCAKTCGHCANVSNPQTSAENIRGDWIIQRNGRQDIVEITENTFTVLGMGTFQAYGPLGKAREMCLKPPLPLKKEAEEYALARLGDGPGCGPRVTQLRAKRISDAVLLLQVAGTAPMMPDKYMTLPKQWCHNNWLDSKHFAHIFRPHWPFSNHHTNPPNGFFSLVHKDPEKQKPDKCLFYSHTVLLPHMHVNVTFGEGDKKTMCSGESIIQGDSSWGLTFDCGTNGPSYNISFGCLGGFAINRKIRGIIIKIEHKEMDSEFNLKDQFYCLLVASKKYHTANKMYLTKLGECDDTHLTMIEWQTRQPFVEITLISVVIPTDPVPVSSAVINGCMSLWALLVLRYTLL